MRAEGLDRFSNTNVKKHNANYLVYKFLIRDLIRASAFAKGKLLDIGCGNKPYESLFNKNVLSYTGCDITQSSLNKVDVICEATSIPLPNEYFDTILCTQTIEHVFDHNKLLKEANRICKKSGILILSGPMYWPLHEEPYDFFRFTKYGLTELVKLHGFEIIEIYENGGKWALFGTVCLQTIPFIFRFKITKRLANHLFEYLDQKYFDGTNTMNYVIVAKKVS